MTYISLVFHINNS